MVNKFQFLQHCKPSGCSTEQRSAFFCFLGMLCSFLDIRECHFRFRTITEVATIVSCIFVLVAKTLSAADRTGTELSRAESLFSRMVTTFFSGNESSKIFLLRQTWTNIILIISCWGKESILITKRETAWSQLGSGLINVSWLEARPALTFSNRSGWQE